MDARTLKPLKVAAAASALMSRPGDAALLILRHLRSLGPYLLIELILPGGTLIAVSMYLYNHRRALPRAASIN